MLRIVLARLSRHPASMRANLGIPPMLLDRNLMSWLLGPLLAD